MRVFDSRNKAERASGNRARRAGVKGLSIMSWLPHYILRTVLTFLILIYSVEENGHFGF